MIMFLFKKIISQLLLPLPLCLGISFTGLFLLYFTRRQRLGKALISIGLVTLTLLSYGFISDRLLRPLENRYKPYVTESAADRPKYPVRFVVVLGGGHTSDPKLPMTSQIDDSSLVRLAEGIRIYRKQPGSKLVLSGGRVFDPVSNAEVMAGIARELGVDREDIIVESRPQDTHDEACIMKSIVGSAPFVLVTSASHMPRAMFLFKKLGMNPIPAPTRHRVKSNQSLSLGSFFPHADDLHKSETAVHEYLGIAWAKLKGQI